MYDFGFTMLFTPGNWNVWLRGHGLNVPIATATRRVDGGWRVTSRGTQQDPRTFTATGPTRRSAAASLMDRIEANGFTTDRGLLRLT